MPYRLGVDIGGTFTDFVLLHGDSGRMAIHKQLTTPRDPSAAVIEGTQTLLARQGVPIGAVDTLVHGTTLVTNAVIERKGAVTGMLVTAGFKDVLLIGRERRYDLFDLRLRFPAPLVPRSRMVEIHERLGYDSEVRTPLDLDEVQRAARTLIEEHGVEAIAVCLLHSYADPRHEFAVRDLLRREFPSVYVSASAEVFPFMREYERWTTTTINAYTQPMVDRYLERLEAGLAELGYRGRIYIMASNGGTITPDTARRFPVRMLESGPAAGVLMASHHGRTLGLPDLLSFDMGGTTAKGSLVRAGEPLKTYAMEVARVHEFKHGSGLPLRVPLIDMIEIGAGGGSIAALDARGVIRVGPQSAGADPGPACYGLGGEQPTLTDANLLLGYLDPAFFLGGAMRLDREASADAINGAIARPLDLDLARAAWGIHEVINEDVARAFRVHASERGFDYRGCSMVAFGGSGPVHALRIARKLRIPRVIFPAAAGVMSAFGLLVSPRAFEIMQTSHVMLPELTPAGLVERFRPLVEMTSGYLRAAGTRERDITIIRRLDMRYHGQGYEIEVALPDEDNPALLVQQLPALFARSYEHVFSISFLDQPIEIVNWKVEARGPLPEVGARQRLERPDGGGRRQKGVRAAYFPERDGYVPCPVYDRYALSPGDVVEGPALVEENESTCVLGVGDTARLDEHFSLVAEIALAEGAP
jgi:N-methylhydantoinase A